LSKKEFVSDVTGEIWHKEHSAKWNKAINHIAVVLEDFTSATKDGGKVVLSKGSEVFIDDIRGRIKPQYRVKDSNGKIWFVPVRLLKILESESDTTTKEVTSETHSYQGGVRTDAQQSNAKH
jgi:hypothetical protein